MLFRKGAFFIDSNLTLRQLQRWFGRVALALTVTFAVTQLLSYGTVLAWSACFGQVDYTTLMVLNDATIYLPCLVLIPLLLRGIPRADPIPDAALSGQEGFLALMFSLGSGYLFSYGTIALVSLLERLLGQTSTNVVSNIESALPPLASVLAFAVVAPVAEEFIFRRLLLDRIRIFGDGAAILIGGAAFGLFHGNLNQTFYAFALGARLYRHRPDDQPDPLHHRHSHVYQRHQRAVHLRECPVVPLPHGHADSLLGALFHRPLFRPPQALHLRARPLPFTSQEKLRACFASPWVWLLFLGGLAFSSVAIFL